MQRYYFRPCHWYWSILLFSCREGCQAAFVHDHARLPQDDRCKADMWHNIPSDISFKRTSPLPTLHNSCRPTREILGTINETQRCEAVG
ncbi:hypothetical protein BDU57DRAFT_522267 [Ampelomyces quisqualis]|uniref:Secreted protein n=1 Tax=Ampelomyces quisqualis TaxID=50730 RepID=A0A6A5QEV2_AMPQU|nr:hypothetical protein BDU57DRAFT_522267 [Ampelomyces quisqualis]